jgi:hypothetical protein
MAGLRETFIAEAEASAAEVDAGAPLYAEPTPPSSRVTMQGWQVARNARRVHKTRKIVAVGAIPMFTPQAFRRA